jgi:hypothetical protein
VAFSQEWSVAICREIYVYDSYGEVGKGEAARVGWGKIFTWALAARRCATVTGIVASRSLKCVGLWLASRFRTSDRRAATRDLLTL